MVLATVSAIGPVTVNLANEIPQNTNTRANIGGRCDADLVHTACLIVTCLPPQPYSAYLTMVKHIFDEGDVGVWVKLRPLVESKQRDPNERKYKGATGEVPCPP